MNRSTLAALVVALMLGSGIAGYLIGRPADRVDTPRTATVTQPTPAAPAAPPATPTTPVAAPTTPPAPAPTSTAPVPLPQPAAAPDEPFAYRRFALDTSRAEGEACLAFNKPLATTNVNYADYVTITPEAKTALRVIDDKLCVSGLAYGENYLVRLRTGFPGRDGVKLAEEKDVDVALGARPAVVTLPGKGFILPRGSAVGLPVTTINVSKVGLAVYRVNERAIMGFARDRYDATYPGSQPVTETYSLYNWLNGRNGALQWKGTMEVRNVTNQPVTTAFPIRETVQDWKPGTYFVVAWNAAQPPASSYEEEENQGGNGSATGMWVMDTDIALTTFSGDDGLNVFARSLQTAMPLAGLEVVLLSRGNEPMAKLMTDEAGRVLFAAGLLKGRGAARAGAVMASNATNQDFSRLELGKTPFDFSDRGVTGRDQPGPVDAFLYTERGVYRPGETVQLMAMLRDASAVALANMPITLIVKRPDGSEFTRFTQPVVAGGVHQPIALPKSSRRGRWTVAAHVDPKAPPVGTVEFSVEDFVPEKLKVELSTSQPFVKPGQVNNFDIQADFLYGAPGSGLTIEADMRITVDAQPFPAFARYSFGSHEERKAFEPPFLTLKAPDTDATGKSRLEWGGDIKDTPLPLRAQVQARVFEPGGGRATKTEKTLPMRTRNAYIGIRPTFEGRYAREGAETQFDVMAVDATGKQIARQGLEYKVERTDWVYQWYEVDGRWRWQSIVNPRLVAADTGRCPAISRRGSA